ncbi:MAG TPA: M28 family peptidase [Thermoanaerobaculia bacterium]
MKRIVLALLIATTALAQQSAIEKDVRTLAADDMEGRGLGTKGIDKATSYLEARMKAIGLDPVFGTSYRQPFPVKIGVSAGTHNKLGDVAAADWTPLGFSSAGAFDAPIAFVGYGISAPPLNYDDYAGIDLKGKVALMLRYEPQEKDERSPFDGRRPSRWSAMRYKVLQARERGAVAVIFATGPLQDDAQNKIPALTNDGPESPAGIPVVQVRTSVAAQWIGDLAKWQKDVDSDLKPRSRVLDATIAGNVDVKAEYAQTANVAGMIPGRGALAGQVVVIGAHYDHLGYGGQGSMTPNVHAIHHGADDNASGTAAVLAIGERLLKQLDDVPNRRTVICVLFSGEEVGLAGSSWFVGHPPQHWPPVAMVNLDMVGMMRDNKLIVFGSDSAPEWKDAIEHATEFAKLNVTASGDGYGPSDQTSFYAKQIPVLHLFTGAHDRYHTPADIADAINYPGIEKSVDFATSIMMHLAAGRVTPQYARATSAPAMEGDSRGYGAYLGTVPDYSAMDATTGGVLLSDVRPGSPAEHAGIAGGDRIVDIGGTRIENLYDMTYALQDHKPGDTVGVKVVRKGEPVQLRATLTQRGAQSAAVAAHSGASEPMKIDAGVPFTKLFDGEKHIQDVRQLTNGGENAEAYFSPDGKRLIFQSTPRGAQCDQEFMLDLVTGERKRISSGKGRTTCGYFEYPKGDKIIYATTDNGRGSGATCPPPADQSKGYAWSIYPGYDIVEANPDGSDPHPMIAGPGYDAEMTWCHKGGKAIFTSVRDGDLDLYEYTVADKKVKRLTNTPGYDGGAYYNAECTEIVWRASRPEGEALTEYRWLLNMFLVRPTVMELWVMNADGTNQRQITHNGAANFCPYFTPDGKKIIYSSNAGDPKGREFDLYLISKNGGEPERITTAPGFDGFPMFSPDGQYMVWASNRADPPSHETNLYIAKWVE